MLDAILTSPFFGLALSAAAWCAGLWVQKKTGWVLCNPLIIAGVLIIAILAVFHIPLEHYNQGASLIQMMLGPVTAVLALNIYHQRAVLKEYFLPVLAGCLAGTLASLGSVLALCRLFQLEEVLTASLLPKSVTTAIALGIAESQGGIQGVAAAAVGIAESQGGIQGVAAAAVILAGLVGAVFAPLFAKWFRITDPVAEGLAIGACSHALGTATAMEIGEIQGAMSSIAICVCGIFTSLLALFL